MAELRLQGIHCNGHLHTVELEKGRVRIDRASASR
jgi:hypothetical protein